MVPRHHLMQQEAMFLLALAHQGDDVQKIFSPVKRSETAVRRDIKKGGAQTLKERLGRPPNLTTHRHIIR